MGVIFWLLLCKLISSNKDIGVNMKKMITGLVLMASVSSFAAQVYTNDSIDLASDGDLSVTAYRSVWSCTNWYMTPSKFKVGSYMDFYGNEEFIMGKHNTFIGLGLVHRLNADITSSLPQNINSLKEKIAKHINNLTSTEREKIYYKDCPSTVSASSIRLNRQTIYQDQNLLASDYNLTGSPSLDFQDLDIFSSAFDGGSANIEFDVSKPNYLDNLEVLFQKSTAIGRRYFKMDSKEYIYGAYIQLHGKMTAEYVASLEKTSCVTDSEENGFQLAALSTTGAGGFMGGGSTSSSETCKFEWLSQLSNAVSDMRLEMHFDKSKDFASKRVQICDDNECSSMTLNQYVETMLLEKWLSINFVADYKRIGDNLFDMTIKRKTGAAHATINNKVEISETQVQGLIYSFPIYSSKDLNFSVPNWIVDDKRRQCAKRNYTASLIMHMNNLKNRNLVPIAPECY